MHLKCAKTQSSPEASINLTIKICSLKLKRLRHSESSCRVIYWLTKAIALYRAKLNNCLIAGPRPTSFFTHYYKHN